MQRSFGPDGQEAPVDRAAQEAAFRSFHDANHREPTIAERKLLRDLAERFEPAARACGLPEMQNGWQWVMAAIFDAVDAGSTYVAPRRVREILIRWEKDGPPGAELATAITEPAPFALGPNRKVMLPHGRDSGSTWAYVVMQLGLAIEQDRLAEYVDGTSIIGFDQDEVVIEARDSDQARKLDGELRGLLVRKLGEAMRRPVGLRVEHSAADLMRPALTEVGSAMRTAIEPFPVADTGLNSAQLWAVVLDDVHRQGSIGKANVEAWLRPAMLIDLLEDGTFVIGAPNSTTRRRIADRFAPALVEAIASVTGERCQIEVVVTREWQSSRHERDERPEISA